MADETPQVSGQPGEADELPTPSFSGNGDSSPSVDADAIVNKLTPILEQLVERKVQSTKDKRLSKIEKALGGRLDLLAELEETGVEIPKDVRTQMQIRDLEERLTQQTTQPAQSVDSGLSTTKQAVTEAIAELSKFELDQNDPDFIKLLRGNYKSRAEFDLEVQRHIVKKLTPSKPANPADVVQSPVRSGAQEKSVEALTSEYRQKMLDAPRGPKGDAVRRALKNEYIQKGVDVHNVDFTS